MIEIRPYKKGHRTDVLITGPDVLQEWREQNRLPVPGHEYMPRFKHGRWDGTWAPGKWIRRNGDAWEMRCSFGLALRISQELGVAAPLRFSPVTADAYLHVLPRWPDFYDYQQEGARAALVRGWGRLALATNAGKGAVIAALVALAKARQFSALILCDELSVYDALQEQLEEWSGGVLVEQIMAGRQAPPPAPSVSLAMVPTLARRVLQPEWVEWLSEQAMVLLDEADKATAPSWRKILRATTGSWWRIGFSGSFPEREKDPYADLQLDELMGPVLSRTRNMDLVERGISARPLVALVAFNITDAIGRYSRSSKSWRNKVYEDAIVNNLHRHAAVAALIRPGVPTAVIVNRIAHGESLTRHIPGAVFLDGSASVDKRHEVLERFRSGEVQVLVVTKILDRGTNRLGHAADLIFASGEGSPRQVLQRIGRGLRRTGGKEFLRLVDVVDRVVVPDGSRKLEKAAEYLHSAATRRLEVYKAEGFDVEITA